MDGVVKFSIHIRAWQWRNKSNGLVWSKEQTKEQQRNNKGLTKEQLWTTRNSQKKNRNSQEQRRNKGKQRWSGLGWVWNSSDEHQYGTEALEGTWLFLKDIWLPSAAPWKTVGDKNTQPPPQPLIHRTNPPNIWTSITSDPSLSVHHTLQSTLSSFFGGTKFSLKSIFLVFILYIFVPC